MADDSIAAVETGSMADYERPYAPGRFAEWVARMLRGVRAENVWRRDGNVFTQDFALPEYVVSAPLRAAIIDALETPDWQLIATAPKDGRFILLTGGEIDNHDPREHDGFPLSPPMVVARWLNDAWAYGFAEANMVCVDYLNPTHWMPLPSPPNEKGEG